MSVSSDLQPTVDELLRVQRKHCSRNAQIIHTISGTRRHRGAKLTAEWSVVCWSSVVGGREESSIEGQEASGGPCVKRVRLVRRHSKESAAAARRHKTCSPRPFVCCPSFIFPQNSNEQSLSSDIKTYTVKSIHTQSLFTTRPLPHQYKMGMISSH
jgi:hypothetical protein